MVLEVYDERGHLITGCLGLWELGSGTDRNNTVPMLKNLNKEAYKGLESDVAKNVRELRNQYPYQRVEGRVTIDVIYPSKNSQAVKL